MKTNRFINPGINDEGQVFYGAKNLYEEQGLMRKHTAYMTEKGDKEVNNLVDGRVYKILVRYENGDAVVSLPFVFAVELGKPIFGMLYGRR